ncbi:MAG: hypothetical protein H6609_02670 [Ignavibacteriales bacterium]|nr:hypothetical protein [Ignavibacteriales bacterium]
MMKTTLKISLAIIFLANAKILSQQTSIPIRFWALQNFDGFIGSEGEYKSENIQLRNSYKDKLNASTLTGRLMFNTLSYFYHPNLLELETNMQFNPGTRKNIYLVVPDRSDIIIGESARGTIRFLKSLPANLSLFTNYSHVFTNREYTTDLETNSFGFGGYFNYRNKVAPINMSYNSNKINQDELRTNRKYLTDRNNLKINSDFAFGENDDNKVSYSFDGYNQEYTNLTRINSNISTYSYLSRIKLDSAYTSSISSNFIYTQNRGYSEYDRFQLNENILYSINPNLKSFGNYRYNNISRNNFESYQQNINLQFEHQLYESLRSYVRFDKIVNNQTFSEEGMNTYGGGLYYRKKIPYGVLNISYDYNLRNVDRNNLQDKLIIINEEITLNDEELIILSNPYIELQSIIVKSLDEITIYQKNVDYIIVARDDYIEIQRLPGGLISKSSSVYIDYVAELQPSYKYTLNSSKFFVRLSLLENLFEVYYRTLNNSYSNINTVYTNMLQIISQNVYGARINYQFISAGIELDDYNSNIIPLKSTNYYMRLSNRFSKDLSVNLSGNLKYIELLEDKRKQEFQDLNGNIIYNIDQNISINLESNYRFQKGRGLDLNLGIIKGEVDFRFRNLFLAIGAEKYKRNFLDEKIDYQGGFVRIQRKF